MNYVEFLEVLLVSNEMLGNINDKYCTIYTIERENKRVSKGDIIIVY